MEQAVSRFRSVYVLHRFGLRLGLLLMITVGQLLVGYETAFFDLVWLFAGVCIALAIVNKEHPLAGTLSHWDEACGFGLIACLG
jgi:hypothetical protein